MQNWETKSTILIKIPLLRCPDDSHLSTLPLADYRIRAASRHAHAPERYGSTPIDNWLITAIIYGMQNINAYCKEMRLFI